MEGEFIKDGAGWDGTKSMSDIVSSLCSAASIMADDCSTKLNQYYVNSLDRKYEFIITLVIGTII